MIWGTPIVKRTIHACTIKMIVLLLCTINMIVQQLGAFFVAVGETCGEICVENCGENCGVLLCARTHAHGTRHMAHTHGTRSRACEMDVYGGSYLIITVAGS